MRLQNVRSRQKIYGVCICAVIERWYRDACTIINDDTVNSMQNNTVERWQRSTFQWKAENVCLSCGFSWCAPLHLRGLINTRTQLNTQFYRSDYKLYGFRFFFFAHEKRREKDKYDKQRTIIKNIASLEVNRMKENTGAGELNQAIARAKKMRYLIFCIHLYILALLPSNNVSVQLIQSYPPFIFWSPNLHDNILPICSQWDLSFQLSVFISLANVTC